MNINHPLHQSDLSRLHELLETQPTRIRSRKLDPARVAYAQTNARNPLFMLRYANRKARSFKPSVEATKAFGITNV